MDATASFKCTSCKKNIDASFNYCIYCGSKLPKNCAKSGLKIQDYYSFSPGCGEKQNTSQPQPASHSGATVEDSSLADIKNKLEAIRAKRRSHGDTMQTKTKNMKMTVLGKASYLLTCGVKEWKGDEWVQFRERGSPYSSIRVSFNRNDKYLDVVKKLSEEFKMNGEDHALVDMGNGEIENNDDFTIFNYVQMHKKYVGSTRIYLGINRDQGERIEDTETSKKCVKDCPSPLITTQEDLAVKPSTPTTSNIEKHTESLDQTRDDCTAVASPGPPDLTPQKTVTPTTGDLPLDMSDVEKYLLAEILENQAQPETRVTIRVDGDQSIVPVSTSNPAVIYIIDLNSSEDKQFTKVQTTHGEFVLFQNEEFEDFTDFREQQSVENLAVVNIPFRYFMPMNKLDINHISENVANVDPFINNEYKDWCESLKESLRANICSP